MIILFEGRLNNKKRKNVAKSKLMACFYCLHSILYKIQMIQGCFGGYSTTMTCCCHMGTMGMYRQRCYCTKIEESSASKKDGLFREGFHLMEMNVLCHLLTTTPGSPTQLILLQQPLSYSSSHCYCSQ